MLPPPRTPNQESFEEAAKRFWASYYDALFASHSGLGRELWHPVKDRNLTTTSSAHVSVFEQYWRAELASALGVPRNEVGPRKIRFRGHRQKSFDACYPLKGEPKILISVKSMQNAYRNLTNRIEEALGDSAVLRAYRSQAVFGFFFFLLDGPVARGTAVRGRHPIAKDASGRSSGVNPFLGLVETGGDFFDLSRVEQYRIVPGARKSKRSGPQDVVSKAELTLMDLVAPMPQAKADIHYDAMAFAPTVIARTSDGGWNATVSPVNPLLDHKQFVKRLVEVARLRGLV